MDFPFKEELQGDKRIRTFSPDVDEEELVWHRDEADRIVKVIRSEGWYLQMDDKLPRSLDVGKSYWIPMHSWHRILKRKSCTELVVEITEFKTHQ